MHLRRLRLEEVSCTSCPHLTGSDDLILHSPRLDILRNEILAETQRHNRGRAAEEN